MIRCIVAVAQDWGIGKDGALLASNKEDMRFFRDKTMGNVVIMGRRTLESFPGGRPLRGRDNIVLTTRKIAEQDGLYVAGSCEKALELARECSAGQKDIYVIGGESVYRQLLGQCEEAYVTKLHCIYEADTYFPDLDKHLDWDLLEQGEEKEYADGTFCFCTYRRKE